jgi:aminopeptidase N
MNMNRGLVFGFVLILAFSSCTIFQKPAATPIPEKPLSEMNSQPPEGVAGNDTIGDAYAPTSGNTGYDVQQYNIGMAFSTQLDVITATVTITSVVTLDNLGRLSLDFSGYTADGVLVGDKYASFYRSADKLYIDLPQEYTNGDELVVRVSYRGQIMTQESALGPISSLGLRTIIGHDLTYTLAEPDGAHDWFPCNDHPLDKATYRFELTVPKGITAAANGTLLQTITSNDRDTFIWAESDPMASYLATAVVGKYERIDNPAVGDVKIRHYVIEGDFDFSDELAATEDMLQYYSGLIGPYPFDEFGFIVVLTNNDNESFGMEDQTLVMISRDQMLGTPAYVLAHEMAHQWFGDSVSLASWNDVWLKEGLATYLGLMWLDHQGLADLSTQLNELEDYLITSGYMLPQPLNMPSPDDMYGQNTYFKSAWVFHMLRQQMGDENFTRFLQEYYQRYAGGNASTTDVQQIAEEISGQDLNAFFQEWVYGVGYPGLAVTWTSQPGSVSLQVCQANRGQIFTIPLEITLTAGDGGSQDQILQIDQREEQVTYSVPFEVRRILTDPAEKLLGMVTVKQVDAFTSCAP